MNGAFYKPRYIDVVKEGAVILYPTFQGFHDDLRNLVNLFKKKRRRKKKGGALYVFFKDFPSRVLMKWKIKPSPPSKALWQMLYGRNRGAE